MSMPDEPKLVIGVEKNLVVVRCDEFDIRMSFETVVKDAQARRLTVQRNKVKCRHGGAERWVADSVYQQVQAYLEKNGFEVEWANPPEPVFSLSRGKDSLVVRCSREVFEVEFPTEFESWRDPWVVIHRSKGVWNPVTVSQEVKEELYRYIESYYKEDEVDVDWR